ncbi:hypothetical protein K0U27_00670 [archaeon]|nr:hypothetical protein [archaeon]
MTFEIGQLTRPGKHNVSTHTMTAGTIEKGKFFTSNTASAAVSLTSAGVTTLGVYVALERASFAEGDTQIQGAGAGSEVIVEVGGPLDTGSLVKLDGVGRIVVATLADIAAGKVVGRFLKVPGETTSRRAVAGDLGVLRIGDI